MVLLNKKKELVLGSSLFFGASCRTDGIRRSVRIGRSAVNPFGTFGKPSQGPGYGLREESSKKDL